MIITSPPSPPPHWTAGWTVTNFVFYAQSSCMNKWFIKTCIANVILESTPMPNSTFTHTAIHFLPTLDRIYTQKWWTHQSHHLPSGWWTPGLPAWWFPQDDFDSRRTGPEHLCPCYKRTFQASVLCNLWHLNFITYYWMWTDIWQWH